VTKASPNLSEKNGFTCKMRNCWYESVAKCRAFPSWFLSPATTTQPWTGAVRASLQSMCRMGGCGTGCSVLTRAVLGGFKSRGMFFSWRRLCVCYWLLEDGKGEDSVLRTKTSPGDLLPLDQLSVFLEVLASRFSGFYKLIWKFWFYMSCFMVCLFPLVLLLV